MSRVSLFLASTAMLAAPALAQTASPSAVHGKTRQDIVVTAPYVRELDILAGKSVLTGDRLTQDIRPQIGDSLVRFRVYPPHPSRRVRRDRCCAASRASASAS